MSAHNTVIQFPMPRDVAWNRHDVERLTEKLQATLDRGATLREEISELMRRDDTLTQELECRLINGLEMIALSLSSQSQAATTPEATRQLTWPPVVSAPSGCPGAGNR